MQDEEGEFAPRSAHWAKQAHGGTSRGPAMRFRSCSIAILTMTQRSASQLSTGGKSDVSSSFTSGSGGWGTFKTMQCWV